MTTLKIPVICVFPGCRRPPVRKQPGKTGPAPKYCPNPGHTRVTAHRAREREANPLEGVTLGQIRAELHRLTLLAGAIENPPPMRVNPPGHAMPGHEWAVEQRTDSHTRGNGPLWRIRTVDDPEHCDTVYVCPPDYGFAGEDFGPIHPEDVRLLGLSLIAAADRCDALKAGASMLEDCRGSAASRV